MSSEKWGLCLEISKNSDGLSPVRKLYMRNSYAFLRNKGNYRARNQNEGLR